MKKKREITFTYIKPDGFEYWEDIISYIIKSGFTILQIAEEPVKFIKEQAELFYCEHIRKPFFEKLVNHTISGPIIAALLEKENTIEDFRKLIGATNPYLAEKGTIREICGDAYLYAEGYPTNAIHGSDSPQSVRRESEFFFPGFLDIEEKELSL